ncbi:Mitochondrial ATPase complex subunit ATP10 [Erysiphe neolycopersici]|uniref:Mitochondrial ATPase complex subunit ATP10 n=1 Tax=Erysiphe neolycopersici TaxID=212602 RepID=A0A420HYI8_9PEZI|nr:Mitochondrial ATPase complex subunit ATP10 [Erysiphe neolycopersici]
MNLQLRPLRLSRSCFHLSDHDRKPDINEANLLSPSAVLQEAPRSYGKDISEYIPKPLDRPIGLPKPPSPGENTGIDARTWRERRDDIVDYEKHLVRRRQLTSKLATPYFREWKNMRFSKGKTFLAPPRLFRSDKALYFPNFFGQTLHLDKKMRDTTPVLKNKISILSVYSSAWGEKQAASFVSKEMHPELHEIIKNSRGLAQIVSINFEENALKAMLIRLFMRSLRKKLGEGNWGRYFLVQKGLTMEIREMIGLLNSKVGYIYLLDDQCKIRWAGSGFSEEDERSSLSKGLKRLIEEQSKLNPV